MRRSRLKDMGCEVFKIINKFSPKYIQDLVKLKSSNYNLRHEKTAEVLRANTIKYGQKSLFEAAHRVWSSLPNEFRKVEYFPRFKRMVHTWDGPILCLFYLSVCC